MQKIPHVVEVTPMPEQRLKLKFDTGEIRVFDAAPYLSVGRFALLKDEALFRQAYISFGTVEWPNGLDFDPEDLYDLSIAE